MNPGNEKSEENITHDYQYPPQLNGKDSIPGDMVKHEYFGRGKVTKISPSSDIAFVDFNGFGSKKLVLEYAKLEKMERSKNIGENIS